MEGMTAMSKKMSRMIGALMLLIGFAFLLFALGHPEMSWPWGNTISRILYFVYIVAMIIFFIAPFEEKAQR